MQLWWSTIISSPGRTSVPATIGEPSATRELTWEKFPKARGDQARAQPSLRSRSASAHSCVCPGVWAAGSKVTSPMLSHAGPASYSMVSVASRRVVGALANGRSRRRTAAASPLDRDDPRCPEVVIVRRTALRPVGIVFSQPSSQSLHSKYCPRGERTSALMLRTDAHQKSKWTFTKALSGSPIKAPAALAATK